VPSKNRRYGADYLGQICNVYVTKGFAASPTYKFSSSFARQQRASTFLHGEYLRVTILRHQIACGK
jgi:hypothetical protein